jgi:hypothetical protein
VVSDPPEVDSDRWPARPLAELGLAGRSLQLEAGHFTVLTKAAAAPERYPRASGRPAKRPLW